MRLYIASVTIVAVLAALVSAVPSPILTWFKSAFSSQASALPDTKSSRQTCMSPSEAHSMANIFRLLIQNYTTNLALSALTPNFHDYASSVNIIINKGAAGPKGMDAPTFASREAFMDGQGKQPPIPFEMLKVWPGCRHVALRWKTGRSANGHEGEVGNIPVHGNVIIEVEPSEPGNEYSWRISNIWSEFNSAAWLVNLGVFKPGGHSPDAQDVKHMQQFDEQVVLIAEDL